MKYTNMKHDIMKPRRASITMNISTNLENKILVFPIFVRHKGQTKFFDHVKSECFLSSRIHVLQKTCLQG